MKEKDNTFKKKDDNDYDDNNSELYNTYCDDNDDDNDGPDVESCSPSIRAEVADTRAAVGEELFTGVDGAPDGNKGDQGAARTQGKIMTL